MTSASTRSRRPSAAKARHTGAELSFTDALVRLAHMVDRVFVEVARERGLTPQHAQLICLLTAGPVRMRELARMLNLEKSGMTGLIDRVEERGLVRRLADDRDRRVWNVALTTEGTAQALDTHAAVTERLESLATSVGATRRAATTSTVRDLLTAHMSATGRDWLRDGTAAQR